MIKPNMKICFALLLVIVMLSSCSSARQRQQVYEDAVKTYDEIHRVLDAYPRLIESLEAFISLGNYKDAQEYVNKAKYALYVNAVELSTNSLGKFDNPFAYAIEIFTYLGDYRDSSKKLEELPRRIYTQARTYMGGVTYTKAIELFSLITDYEDADQLRIECIYLEAINAYGNPEKIDTSMGLFKSLPDGYKDSGLYMEMLAAIELYNSDNWLEALHTVDSVIMSTNTKADPDWYSYTLKTPYHMAQMLWGYWAERDQLDEDIASLPEYAYQPFSDNQYGAGNLSIKHLYTKRSEMLKESISQQGLSGYYALTDHSVSPVKVTGTGLYVNCENATKNTSLLDLYGILHKYIAPCCFAAKPEDVRYVLSFSESYEFYLSYNNNTKGYSTTTLVTLKDVMTGEILFQGKYVAKPPGTAPLRNIDEYGKYDFTDAMKNDILPVLSSLLIVY